MHGEPVCSLLSLVKWTWLPAWRQRGNDKRVCCKWSRGKGGKGDKDQQLSASKTLEILVSGVCHAPAAMYTCENSTEPTVRNREKKLDSTPGSCYFSSSRLKLPPTWINQCGYVPVCSHPPRATGLSREPQLLWSQDEHSLLGTLAAAWSSLDFPFEHSSPQPHD